jgi:hypothetical protein
MKNCPATIGLSFSTRILRNTGILLSGIAGIVLIPGAGWGQTNQRKHATSVHEGGRGAPEETLASLENAGAGDGFVRADNTRACMSIYKNALDREQRGHLREARDLLLSCAKAACGSFLLQECTARYTRLESDIPSVVLSVSDRGGSPRPEAQVKVDGKMLPSQINGRALPLDPGIHEFSFVAGGEVFATQKIMLLQGQRNRPVAASLTTPILTTSLTTPTPSEQAIERVVSAESVASVGSGDAQLDLAAVAQRPTAPRGALPYVFTAAGLAGLGGSALLFYWAKSDNAKAAACLPGCSQAGGDHIRRLDLVADVSVGVGAAFLIAGAWLFFRSSPMQEGGSPKSNYQLDVATTSSGAVATVSGAF